MRWLFHIKKADEPIGADAYSPASLEREGFIHASFRDSVLESARLYFDASSALDVLQVDPRRLTAVVVLADTPRGPMPHVHGVIRGPAITAVYPLARFAALLGQGAVPDAVDEV